MFNKIKAVKDLRSQAKQVQKQLEEVTVEGSAAWGKLKVTMNGNQKVLDIHIDDELMSDKAKLVDALKEAFADTTKAMQKKMASQMKDMGNLQEMMKNLGL